MTTSMSPVRTFQKSEGRHPSSTNRVSNVTTGISSVLRETSCTRQVLKIQPQRRRGMKAPQSLKNTLRNSVHLKGKFLIIIILNLSVLFLKSLSFTVGLVTNFVQFAETLVVLFSHIVTMTRRIPNIPTFTFTFTLHLGVPAYSDNRCVPTYLRAPGGQVNQNGWLRPLRTISNPWVKSLHFAAGQPQAQMERAFSEDLTGRDAQSICAQRDALGDEPPCGVQCTEMCVSIWVVRVHTETDGKWGSFHFQTKGCQQRLNGPCSG